MEVRLVGIQSHMSVSVLMLRVIPGKILCTVCLSMFIPIPLIRGNENDDDESPFLLMQFVMNTCM